MADSVYDLTAIQMALQAALSTAVPTSTYNWAGRGALKIVEPITVPNYMTGEPGVMTVEDAYPGSAGSVLTLSDTPLSPTLMVWLGLMGIKSVTLTPSITSWAFALPTAQTANTIRWFTFKMATMHQVYTMPDCFCTDFNISGDADSNNGTVMVNAKLAGRKVTAADSLTASLGLPPAHTSSILNFNNATVKFAALGTAPSGGTQQTGQLRAISLDWKTGFQPGMYADGRSSLDYAQVDGGGLAPEITGRMKVLFGAGSAGTGAATHVANARAGTGINVSISIANGTPTVVMAFPIVFTDIPEIGGTNDKSMLFAEFPFRVGYSRTATALAPSITVTTAALSVT